MIRFRLRYPNAPFRLACNTTPDPRPEPLTAICFALGGGVAMAAILNWMM